MPWHSGSFGSPQDTRDQLCFQADRGERPQRDRGQEDTDQGSLTLSLPLQDLGLELGERCHSGHLWTLKV